MIARPPLKERVGDDDDDACNLNGEYWKKITALVHPVTICQPDFTSFRCLVTESSGVLEGKNHTNGDQDTFRINSPLTRNEFPLSIAFRIFFFDSPSMKGLLLLTALTCSNRLQGAFLIMNVEAVFGQRAKYQYMQLQCSAK